MPQEEFVILPLDNATHAQLYSSQVSAVATRDLENWGIMVIKEFVYYPRSVNGGSILLENVRTPMKVIVSKRNQVTLQHFDIVGRVELTVQENEIMKLKL